VSAAGSNPTTLTFTLANDSSGSAVLGSANITSPTGVTLLGQPTIDLVSGNKSWSATRVNQTIQLRSLGDLQKLSPGEAITISINATLATTEGTTYAFTTAAKPSANFAGSAAFTRLGPNPALTVCGSTCGASVGDVNNPVPDHEAGSFTLDGSCTGCFVSIGETLGDFCSTAPPAACKAPFVPQFSIDPSYTGTVHFILSCDKSNCPPPPPCGECPDFYPIFYTETNAPTNSGQTVVQLSFCNFHSPVPPCIEEQHRISSGPGTGDLQSTILLFFEPPPCISCTDPRPGY